MSDYDILDYEYLDPSGTTQAERNENVKRNNDNYQKPINFEWIKRRCLFQDSRCGICGRQLLMLDNPKVDWPNADFPVVYRRDAKRVYCNGNCILVCRSKVHLVGDRDE